LSVAQNVQREYTLQRSVGKGHSLLPLWNQARVEGLFAGEPRPRFLFGVAGFRAHGVMPWDRALRKRK
jgi:hypothetical protein